MASTRDHGKAASEAALTPILRARLHPPQVPDCYVRRARLLELLNEVTRVSLAVVVAPAGAGKTLTLAGWVSESTVPTPWLSLDDSDRYAVQLWMSLTAALQMLAPECGQRARAMLYRGMVSEAVDRLVTDL